MVIVITRDLNEELHYETLDKAIRMSYRRDTIIYYSEEVKCWVYFDRSYAYRI